MAALARSKWFRNSTVRILVVEDEPDLRRGLVQALREEGYAVDDAPDGHEGLYKAKAWQYDAIILDLMLPGLDGLSVLDELRQHQSTPVLILTARDTTADKVKGLDLGADDYLVKPFQLVELKARLRALIRRAAGEASSTIQVQDVVIDTASQQVSQGGSTLDLTATEYRLLELLLLHRNQLVSRAMIYDHIFDENHDSLSNLVDVYISRLRSHLGRDFIVTRRGQGYIIND